MQIGIGKGVFAVFASTNLALNYIMEACCS